MWIFQLLDIEVWTKVQRLQNPKGLPLRCCLKLVLCQLVMGILDSLVGQPPLESSPLDMEDKCQCRKPIQFLTPILADIVLKKGQKRTGNASTYKLRASLHTRHDGNIAGSQ